MNSGLEKALRLAGGQTALANIVGLTPQAVQKWVSLGSFPRTEWTGETGYIGLIEKQFQGEVTREELLDRSEVEMS